MGEDKKVFKIWCWIVTALVWLSILNLVYSIITDDEDKMKSRSAMTYFGGLYAFYLITEGISSTCCYLLHPTSGGTIYSYMEKLFSTPAYHVFYVKCYHFQTKTVQVRDAQGNMTFKTEQEKVYTHEASEKFYYTSWRDISGRFVLDTSGAMQNTEKAFVKLHLKLDLQCAKDGTQDDLERQKRSFYWRNNKDTHQEQHEADELEGFLEYNLVRVTDFNPKFFGLLWYIISMVLTVCEFYKTYVDKFCIEQNYTITKVVSSKDNINKPELLVQYQQFLPCIIYMGQTKMYDIQFVAPTLVLPSYEFDVNFNVGATGSVTVTTPVMAPQASITMNAGPTMHMTANMPGMTMTTTNAGMTVNANMPGMTVNANMPGITMTANASTPLLH